MFHKIKEMPRCQDGRICKNQKNGFIVVRFENGYKFICGDCYLQARKDFLKETIKEILNENVNT